jgi:hypothetical protein
MTYLFHFLSLFLFTFNVYFPSPSLLPIPLALSSLLFCLTFPISFDFLFPFFPSLKCFVSIYLPIFNCIGAVSGLLAYLVE